MMQFCCYFLHNETLLDPPLPCINDGMILCTKIECWDIWFSFKPHIELRGGGVLCEDNWKTCENFITVSRSFGHDCSLESTIVVISLD